MSRLCLIGGIVLTLAAGAAQAQSQRDLCATPSLPPDQLIEACTRAIATGTWGQSELAWAFNNRGNAHVALGKYDHAIGDYTQAMGLKPNYPMALVNRGTAYLLQGDGGHALQDFDQALKLAPHDPKALNARCVGLARFGRPHDALRDCNRSLELNPRDAKFLDSRGYAYLRAGRPSEAIASYDAALTIEPRLAVALFGRGVAREQKGEAAGIEDLQAARAIDPLVDAEMASLGIRPKSAAKSAEADRPALTPATSRTRR